MTSTRTFSTSSTSVSAVQARQAAVHALAERGLSTHEIARWVGLSVDHVRRVRRTAVNEQTA
jgi:DNA-binding NarL/FixJ family response regulator